MLSADQDEAGIVAIPPAERSNRPLWCAVVLRLTEIMCVSIKDEAWFQLCNQLIHTNTVQSDFISSTLS